MYVLWYMYMCTYDTYICSYVITVQMRKHVMPMSWLQMKQSMVILWTSLLAEKLADTPSISRALEVNIYAVHAHRILMFSPWAAGRLKHILEDSYWTPKKTYFCKFQTISVRFFSDLCPSECVLPVTFTVQRENCTGSFFSQLAMLWSI